VTITNKNTHQPTHLRPQPAAGTSEPVSRWSTLRADLRRRHNARVDRRNLELQLASYSSEAQISELEAIFSRYEGSDVAELRTVIQRARAVA
jgi:hypothetical protein